MKSSLQACVISIILLGLSLSSSAQTGRDTTLRQIRKSMFFPYPVKNKTWRNSLGFTLTAMPQDISEEVQLRVPAGDWHVIRGLPKGFYLDGRVNFQFLQNQTSIGIRWAKPITKRFSVSIGDDFAFWFGKLVIASFDTKAYGWNNSPNVSFGYQLERDLLVSVKTEAIIVLSSRSRVGGYVVSSERVSLAGWATTIMVEQPFYAKKDISLGLRIMYTNFYWQTWPLYESFDRNIFYPEIIVGFIL